MFQQSLVREDGSKGKNGEDVLGEVSDEDKERLLNLVGVEHGDDKLAILFTCNVCETRSGKKISRQAYDNGVVIARCPGCDNLHLIADRLDYFGDDWDIEKVMEKHGDSINVIDSDDEKVLQLTFDAVKKDD
jgi:protein import protein ZIM17|eukprot:g2677.t1